MGPPPPRECGSSISSSCNAAHRAACNCSTLICLRD
jgi:hypothetical protein